MPPSETKKIEEKIKCKPDFKMIIIRVKKTKQKILSNCCRSSKHCLCAALIPTQPAEEAPQRREFALQGCERAIANSLGEARPLVEGPGSG